MRPRRKLTLTEFFDRIDAGLRCDAPSSRRRIRGDDGLLIWRRDGVKAGVVVSPSLGGAYVFLQRARSAVTTDGEAVRVLKAIFAGEVIEVRAEGPRDSAVWLARADAPSAHIQTLNRSWSAADVPVFTSMAFQGWR